MIVYDAWARCLICNANVILYLNVFIQKITLHVDTILIIYLAWATGELQHFTYLFLNNASINSLLKII